MNESQKTTPGYTLTGEGMLPHKLHPSRKFKMPVAISFLNKRSINGHRIYVPMRDKKTGGLCYALPGGGVFVDIEGSTK